MKLWQTWATIATIAAIPAAPLLAQSMSPGTFVAKAGASDLYEKTSSQLVLATTRNGEVRRFAQMMIRDHTKSTRDVKQAAAASRVRVLPPRLSPEQSRMVGELRRTRGAERDRTYIEQQRVSHRQALDLHRSYSRDGRAAPLRRVAANTVPVVQHHLDMLRDMR